MGRGAQQQTMQLTDQQLASQNAMNQQLYGQSQSLQNTAAAGYQNLLANPGYTPAQQTAINGQSMGALASTFAALASSAANRLARTNNSAGYGDMLTQSPDSRDSKLRVSRSKISSPSPASPSRTSSPRCKASPACTA